MTVANRLSMQSDLYDAHLVIMWLVVGVLQKTTHHAIVWPSRSEF